MGVPKFFAWLMKNYKQKHFVFTKESNIDENEEFEFELPPSSKNSKENKKKQSKKRNKGNKIKAYPTRKNKKNENIEFDVVDDF